MKSNKIIKGILLPFLLVTVSVCIIYSSCKHEPTPPPPPPIPTGTNITPDGICFQENILPIIQSNCAISGCHDGTGEENFSLSNYSNIMASEIVKAGNPSESKLYKVLIASPNSEEFMPPSPYLPLTSDQIGLIYWWISQGALDNP
ncbi:MAG: hypothetical protein HGB12_12790, partial [Bacteroidetes bacterium]|nr:hypothetical protein [Bacteroidota bacterium]